MSKYKDCPICSGEYTKIHMSHRICTNHQEEGWIVTTCPDCKVARFSITRGVCSSCLEKSPKITGFGFNRNRRAGLNRNGMGCQENG